MGKRTNDKQHQEKKLETEWDVGKIEEKNINALWKVQCPPYVFSLGPVALCLIFCGLVLFYKSSVLTFNTYVPQV